MNRFIETITAFASGDFPGAVRISRKEREPMSDERFRLIVYRLTVSVFVIAATVFMINASPAKIGIASFAGVLLSLIYFGMKD